jgi:signal transduction histidine kinase
MSILKHYPPSIQWWFERLDAFPDSCGGNGGGSGEASREQGLLKSLLMEIDRLLPMVHTAVYLVQQDNLELEMRACNNALWETELQAVGAAQIQRGLIAWTLKSGHPAVVEASADNPHQQVTIVPLLTVRSIIGICLILRDRLHGEISLEQLKILSILASQFAFLIENQRLFRKLETQNQDLERQVQQRTRDLEASLRSLEQMNQGILEMTRVKSRFLTNTSHELRTPLNSIIGFLHLIKDGLYDTKEEHNEFVEHALESAQHLLMLINDLLDIAKIEAGKMTVDSQTVQLAGLFEEARILMQVQALHKGLNLTFDLQDDANLELRADSRRLKQVLVNLIGNAIKFTPSGGVSVCAAATEEGQWCKITIADTGVGIDEKILSRLGKAFVQGDVDTTHRAGGTGLGLAISRALIELMGGTLTMNSEGHGHGTTVTLRLPLARISGPVLSGDGPMIPSPCPPDVTNREL